MSDTNRRVSMNTALKNARIFDDDSWDSDRVYKTLDIKTETLDCNSDNAQFECINPAQANIKGKPIPTSEVTKEQERLGPKLRSKVKQETTDGHLKPRNSTLLFRDAINLKLPEDDFNCGSSIKQEVEEETTDSTDSTSNHSRKSLKRSVFKREGPYLKREASIMQDMPDPTSKGPNNVLQPKEAETQHSENGVQKKRKIEYEHDPEILSRRQKQIDFGKNTLGYDNYSKAVSRRERTSEDPATPNKNIKYSRRAWDGLIKQWRLMLHKYDP